LSLVVRSVNNFTLFSTTNFTSNLTLNTWNHVAIVRNNSNWSFYVNGNFLSTQVRSLAGTNTGLTIGGYYDNNYPLRGYMDSFRITNAIRYTANFNPETDTYLAY
jgi:tRNA U38,U39,U40 pseudouridine synthase TruA